ncbi:MAG: hypothetical protein ABSF12_02890 [Bryobacteraceae bacterium]|jgi:hypothetical protein
MTDTQVLILALPSVLSVVAVLVGILINNSRLGDLNTRMSDLRSELRGSISELRSHMDKQFSHVDNRFDDMRDTWRAELLRVQEVSDARLRHLEQR